MQYCSSHTSGDIVAVVNDDNADDDDDVLPVQ